MGTRPANNPTGARKWTDAEKEHALRLALALGATAAAKQTGVPRGTIANWVRQHERDVEHVDAPNDARTRVAQLEWHERRSVLASMMADTAADAVQQLRERINARQLKPRELIAALDLVLTHAAKLGGPADGNGETGGVIDTTDADQRAEEARAQAMEILAQLAERTTP